jgi:hypothetical protein
MWHLRVLKRISEPKWQEVTGGERKWHNELYNLSPPTIIIMTRWRTLILLEHAVSTGEIRKAYRTRWPPLWSSDQSSWLQIQTPWPDSRRYQIFWQVVGFGRGPLTIVFKFEELLYIKKKRLRSRKPRIGSTDPSCWPRNTFYLQKLALTSGGRSLGIVLLPTQATEFVLLQDKAQLQALVNTVINIRVTKRQGIPPPAGARTPSPYLTAGDIRHFMARSQSWPAVSYTDKVIRSHWTKHNVIYSDADNKCWMAINRWIRNNMNICVGIQKTWCMPFASK